METDESGSDKEPEEDELEDAKTAKMKKPKKKAVRKKGKKKPKVRTPKDMVRNEQGELVSVREYTLELTLASTTLSLNQCQERLVNLAKTNEALQETLQYQESDALEVISALHKGSDLKDVQIQQLHEKIEQLNVSNVVDSKSVVDQYESRMNDMSTIMNEKESAFKVMQQEFATIKDFRRKRRDLMQELEYQKQELVDTENRHKEVVARLEKRFFEEKLRLQKEAQRKIGELAAKAHKEAVLNLRDTTKEVFKENIRMAEALRYHVQQSAELSKMNEKLLSSNSNLTEEHDLNNVIVKDKIRQTRCQTQEISTLKAKIQNMEHALAHVVKEFEQERNMIGELARQELEDVRQVVKRLRLNLSRKSSEMKHIKMLSQHILNQRTELERYFMDSIEHVKSEIKDEIEKAMKAQSRDAHRARLGGVQSIEDKPDVSTNPKSNLADLSWSEKEKVLRVLFAKMNGTSLAKAAEKADLLRQEMAEIRQTSERPYNGFSQQIDKTKDPFSSDDIYSEIAA